MLQYLILVQSLLSISFGGLTALLTALYYVDILPWLCCRDNDHLTQWVLATEMLYLVGHTIDVTINVYLLYVLDRRRAAALRGFGNANTRRMELVHHAIVVLGLLYLQYWGTAYAEWSRFIIGISLLETPTVFVSIRVLLWVLRFELVLHVAQSAQPTKSASTAAPAAASWHIRVLSEWVTVRSLDRLLVLTDLALAVVFIVTRTLVLMLHLVPLWLQMPTLLTSWSSRVCVWILFNGLGLVNAYFSYRMWLHVRKQYALWQRSGGSGFVMTHYTMEQLSRQTMEYAWEQFRKL